jgi:allantoicase
LSDFTQLLDLAGERLGGAAIAANDEFFAEKENLLKPAKPIFIEDKYNDRGKWMDGWETRRRRTPGHDWCIVRLGLPGILRGVDVDTSFFRGNFPSHCSLEACSANHSSTAEELTAPGTIWREILPRTELHGDSQNLISVVDPHRHTHVRLNIFPDGGVARLRLYGEVIPEWGELLGDAKGLDLAAAATGGRPLLCSDMFYSAPQNLLMPYAAKNMADGWETKRRRGPGHDWAIIKLGIAGEIHRLEVDTKHFKGNFPDSCSLDALGGTWTGNESPDQLPWQEILPQSKLRADSLHVFENELRRLPEAKLIRLNIYPDGGVSRLRVWGKPTAAGVAEQKLRWFNSLDRDRAGHELLNCCGTQKWVAGMLDARPFASLDEISLRAENQFARLNPDDLREAFRHHPRIGERNSAAAQSAQAQKWSQQEQAHATESTDVKQKLAEANREYEARFGHIFIMCANAKSGDEILSALQQRLSNQPAEELAIAAEEQRKITLLRLEKLFQA